MLLCARRDSARTTATRFRGNPPRLAKLPPRSTKIRRSQSRSNRSLTERTHENNLYRRRRGCHALRVRKLPEKLGYRSRPARRSQRRLQPEVTLTRLPRRCNARAVCAALCIAASVASVALAATKRSAHQRLRFIVENGGPRDSAWLVDHKWPLCAGGCDCAENMQWQQLPQSRAKDRDEVRLCKGYITPALYSERWHVAPLTSPCPCKS